MKFSKKFRSFTAWLRNKPRTSRYAKTIIKKHAFFPDRALFELLDTNINKELLSKRNWIDLSIKDKASRNRALAVLNKLRKGESLKSVIHNFGVTKEFVQKHLGHYFIKKGHWKVVKFDRLQSSMLFFKKDTGIMHIITTNSKDRSKIGKYFANVKKALRTNDPSWLKPFSRMKIKDASGKIHQFETDLEKLKQIEEGIEEPEYLQIYKDR